MASKTLNSKLSDAKLAKQDEFYTQLPDIERELRHYKKHFKGKSVYLNCDDPRVSNFFHYFSYNFKKLGLKKLIATCYKSQQADLFSQNDSEEAIYLEYEGDKHGKNVPDPEDIGIKALKSDGDFRSAESVELLAQADIVVTNPPFSLFREYVSQLIEADKRFLIVGNQNAISSFSPSSRATKCGLATIAATWNSRFPTTIHLARLGTGLMRMDRSGGAWAMPAGSLTSTSRSGTRT